MNAYSCGQIHIYIAYTLLVNLHYVYNDINIHTKLYICKYKFTIVIILYNIHISVLLGTNSIDNSSKYILALL